VDESATVNGASTRSFHTQGTTELAELPVVVVDQEFGLFLEARVPDLLFRPLKRWVLSHVEVDELSTRELHNDEHVENTKSDRVLHIEILKSTCL
jgi:hypothetical protein